MNVLAEEPIDTGFIAEEQFLHNHQECIKQHTIGTDMDHFLETLRLSSGNKLVSPHCLSPLISRLKHESPLRLLQYEQMAELQISAVRSHPNYELSELDSPQLPSIRMHWKDQDMANCIDSTVTAEMVFSQEVKKLQADQFKPFEQVTLKPFERDHACVVGGCRVLKKQKAAPAS